MHRSLLVAAISLFLVACHHHSASDGKSGYGNATFSPGITEADVSQHVKVLASDAFEGRAPGSKGEQRTTEYLIQQFQRMGLQPGNQGSWLQAVPYVQATLQHADQVQLAIDGGKGKSELGFGSDMVVGSPAGEPHAAITDSPIVNIYHGAVDNASGVAGLLEIAEAFAHRRPKPPRTILFMALTMEESGLLGSRYYVNHPVLPLDLTLADLDLDALTVIGPSRDIAVIGYGQSQLDDYLADEARKQRRTVTPDAVPKPGFFARSGQFNFARAGVPVLYARSGLDMLDGGVVAGRKAYDDYIANRYQQPTDAFDPNWDLRGMVQDLRVLYMVGSKLANAKALFPQWKPGSDFRRPGAEAK